MIEVRSADIDINAVRPLLEQLKDVCEIVGADFLVIGALARDLHFHDQDRKADTPRMTRDVDVAVAVSSWENYDQVREQLLDVHGFGEGDQKQRVISPQGTVLDLVPYGGVEDSSGKVRFPPEGTPEMTTLGMREAMEAAITARLDGVLDLKVVSLPGLGVLKLIAWDERRTRTKDAHDLCFIMGQYYHIRINHINSNHIDLYDDVEPYDIRYLSSRAYGRDIASIVNGCSSLQGLIISILRRETMDIFDSELVEAMNQSRCPDDRKVRHNCVKALLHGIEENIG